MSTSTVRTMKVEDIQSIISSSSLQEIYNSFVSIIDRIFSIDSPDSYWDILSRNKAKTEYDKIIQFLSPTGQLMDLILKRLTTDKSIIYYEYPVNRLSLYTQNLILNNSAPVFISSKLVSKSHGVQNSVLYLNAFEYYIFSFLNYITHPNSTKKIDWNGATDSIYCQLVLRYFDFFFFNCRESSTLTQMALQSRSRLGCLNQSFSRVPLLSPVSIQSKANDYHSTSMRSRFVKPDWSGVDWNANFNRDVRDSKQALELVELFHTDTFLQSIIEFWFNRVLPVAYDNGHSIIGHFDLYRQSDCVDRVCLVRLFLKHCYHFCFRRILRFLQPDCQIECDFLVKLNFYRQQIIPKFLLPKTFSYLKSCFQIWPADLTFKIVMETWLSALQPWRYVDSYQHPSDNELNTSNSGSMVGVSDEWLDFINQNFELYSHLLMQFIRRLARIDLAVARNAHMLFRVAKVMNQQNLGRYLNLAQESRIRDQMDSEWEQIRSQLTFVFTEIDSVIERLECPNECANRSLWHTVWDFFSSDFMTSNNPKRIVGMLKQSQVNLSEVLGVRYQQEFSSRPQTDRNDFLEHHNCQPDHVITSKGIQLTEYGRFQVTNRLCQLNFSSNIDYYRRPVCSFEFGLIVRICEKISGAICGHYDRQLRAVCCRPDFYGRLSRFLLIGERKPSTQTGKASTEEESTELRKWVESHSINVRLRFLATKAFLFWLFIAYLLCHFIFDVGAVSLVTGGSIMYFIFTILMVATTGFE